MPTKTTFETKWHSKEVTCAVAKIGLKNSEYDFVRGGRGGDFFDVDEFFGEKRDPQAEETLQAVVEKIVSIHQRTPLRAVVFLERDSGPVGLICARSMFAEQIPLPFLTLRPRKRIRKAALKGGQLKAGECVVIVTDVSTTGETIAEAARFILDQGGRVVAAVSFVDRESGAKEMLGQMEIPLEFVYTIPQLQASVQDEI